MSEFFIELEPGPPTVTAQQKRVRVSNGKPVFYDSPEAKKARAIFTAKLAWHKPKSPINGPVALETVWIFPGKLGWHTGKPDLDNINKIFIDCMTRVGFWTDDALVVDAHFRKINRPQNHGILVVVDPVDDLLGRKGGERHG